MHLAAVMHAAEILTIRLNRPSELALWIVAAEPAVRDLLVKARRQRSACGSGVTRRAALHFRRAWKRPIPFSPGPV